MSKLRALVLVSMLGFSGCYGGDAQPQGEEAEAKEGQEATQKQGVADPTVALIQQLEEAKEHSETCKRDRDRIRRETSQTLADLDRQLAQCHEQLSAATGKPVPEEIQAKNNCKFPTTSVHERKEGAQEAREIQRPEEPKPGEAEKKMEPKAESQKAPPTDPAASAVAPAAAP